MIRLIKYLLKIDFTRFCVVGAMGFAINFILLQFIKDMLGVNVFIAQLIAGELSLLHNFIWHQNWTYRGISKKSVKELLIEFHVTSWIAILGGAFFVGLLEERYSYGNLPALAITSFILLFWNFLWTKLFVWRKKDSFVVAQGEEDEIDVN